LKHSSRIPPAYSAGYCQDYGKNYHQVDLSATTTTTTTTIIIIIIIIILVVVL
jgi:hypothetical protein